MPRKYKKVTREHKPRTRVKEDSRARAIALIDAGLNTSQIEDQTGVSRSQIRRYKRNLRLWNHPSAPRFKAPGRPPKSAAARAQKEAESERTAQLPHADLAQLPDADQPLIHAQPPHDPNAPTRIAELASVIATNTAIVDHYLRANNLPPPSFHVDGPVELIPPGAPDIQQAHAAALEATSELQDLLAGPLSLCRPSMNGTSLHAIHQYGIAQKVPLQGSISFVQLAKQCKISEPDIRRLLRYAMSHHRVFCEPAIGFVAHTAASRRLAEDLKLQDEVGVMYDDIYPSFARTVDSLRQFQGDEPNQCGFTLAHDTDLNLHAYLQKRPDKERQLTNTLEALPGAAATVDDLGGAAGSIHPFAGDLLLSGVQWELLPPGSTVVDVAGAPRFASLALADVFPHLSLVVQGRAAALRDARVPAHLAERVSVVPHDLFGEQPVVGADVYLFRALFRHWPDKYCVRILQKLVPALKPGARVLINDVVLAEPKTLPLLAERRARAADMIMMTLCNSKERERGDWARLLERADKRLRISNIQVPAGGKGMGIIEAVFAD